MTCFWSSSACPGESAVTLFFRPSQVVEYSTTLPTATIAPAIPIRSPSEIHQAIETALRSNSKAVSSWQIWTSLFQKEMQASVFGEYLKHYFIECHIADWLWVANNRRHVAPRWHNLHSKFRPRHGWSGILFIGRLEAVRTWRRQPQWQSLREADEWA